MDTWCHISINLVGMTVHNIGRNQPIWSMSYINMAVYPLTIRSGDFVGFHFDV